MDIINAAVFCSIFFVIVFLIMCCFEVYRGRKLENLPSHYKQALSEAGYALYCDYKNKFFKFNKWGIRKHSEQKPIVLMTADDLYPKLKGCFTYTTNKIYVDINKIDLLYKSCNTLKQKPLKEW
ncbi:hypothetical protein ASswx1_338 [Aeromonas phage Asswx_1]|uniref:Uncharacterized protein n=1 Tax=Aeromonas phage Asswx_1 TaxID=2419739 RepID=A0A411B8N4_9CAUD|nr:hypothetical protein ASswx1_338 [Aeromonas phage Asswx_1]